MRQPVKVMAVYQDLKKAILAGAYPAGSFLPNETLLAQRLKISRNTLRSVLTRLAEDKLIERMCPKGTMVCGKGRKELQTPITFLLPCADFISDVEENPDARICRRILKGVTQVAFEHNYRVETVPVSPTNYNSDIDWRKVEHLNSDSIVIISSPWYHKLFPFLHECACKVALIHTQTYEIETCADYLKDWFLIEMKRAEALCSAVQYMNKLGQRRIALMHGNLSEKNHPALRGYLSGLKKCGLAYSAWLETPETRISAQEVITIVSDFYKENKFDALLTSSIFLSPLRQQASVYRALGIPDSVKVLTVDSSEFFPNTYPSLYRIDFPWEEAGRYGARALIQSDKCKKNKSFDATIIAGTD